MKRDNSRDLFKHIEELTLENEALRRENSELRAENRKLKAENLRLRERIAELETTMEERIAEAVRKAVAAAVEPLLAKIENQEKEISRLKAQLAKDSSNSSKPPSSNGFKKVPNSREKSGRRQGGQKEHEGSNLRIPENLAELVAKGKAEHIVIDLTDGTEKYVSNFIVDVKMVTVFIEVRKPAGKPPNIRYGNNIKILAVYLSVVGLIAVKRLSDFFRTFTDGLVTVSGATITGFVREAADKINMEPLVTDLLNGEVLHVDETPVKTTELHSNKEPPKGKKTFNAYIRTYSNGTTTVLTANERKDNTSVKADNILPRFHGIVAQDHESKFYNYGSRHATCCAHLLRELKGLEELYNIPFAGEIAAFFRKMNATKNANLQSGVNFCAPSLLRSFESRYDNLVLDGEILLKQMGSKGFGFKELNCIVNRLRSRKDSYMLFIRDYNAPFTNNQAERDLRHCKTKQKISGCFRSWQGILDYCKISSFISTVKKRGQSLIDELAVLINGGVPAEQ